MCNFFEYLVRALLASIFFIFSASYVSAEPSELLFVKNKAAWDDTSSRRYVLAAHKEIKYQSVDTDRVRYHLLNAMLNTRGYKWVLEGEGDDHFLARFDYRGETIIMRIEYNERLIQLKYENSSKYYACENLQENGICLKNTRNYFNYVKNLRSSIAREFNSK